MRPGSDSGVWILPSALTRLYALEARVRGVRWHLLDEDTKRELRAFAEGVEAQSGIAAID